MTTPTPENAPPGTEVVCIKTPRPCGGAEKPQAGNIYTVNRWIFLVDGPAIDLVETIHPVFCDHPPNFRLLNLAGLDNLLTERAPSDLENA